MAWMIQPHNWMQAVRPNLYNVGYKRNLAYKGMGRGMGQLYRPGTVPLGRYISTGMGQGIMQGVDNPQSVLPITNPTYEATNFPSVEAATYGSGGAGPYTVLPTTTNWLPWILGGFVVLALMAGGRR